MVSAGEDGVGLMCMIDMLLVKRYTAICAGCEGSERNKTRSFRSPR